MPPRLRLPRGLPGSFVAHRATSSVLPFLAPALHQQPASRASPLLQTTAIRSQSILSRLSDNPAAYNKRIRRGRGPSSGKGKTSGRGHKGQRQHGKVPAGFEGGQTPIWKVKGLRGFKNVHTPEFNTVPISRILSWIAQGRIDPNKPITVRELALSRCVSNIKDGVKLLATSKYHDLSIDEVPPLSQPLNIVVSRASKQAISAVEAAGGSVLTRYYTNFAIRKIVEGDMDPIYSLQSQLPDGTTPRDRQAAVLREEQEAENNGEAWSDRAEQQLLAEEGSPYKYRLPDATSRRDIQYYRDPEHRGYLAYQLKEGENPSLFFKSPEEYASYAKKSEATKKARAKVDTQRLF